MSYPFLTEGCARRAGIHSFIHSLWPPISHVHSFIHPSTEDPRDLTHSIVSSTIASKLLDHAGKAGSLRFCNVPLRGANQGAWEQRRWDTGKNFQTRHNCPSPPSATVTQHLWQGPDYLTTLHGYPRQTPARHQ